jgi:hypothetical protein
MVSGQPHRFSDEDQDLAYGHGVAEGSRERPMSFLPAVIISMAPMPAVAFNMAGVHDRRLMLRTAMAIRAMIGMPIPPESVRARAAGFSYAFLRGAIFF